MILGQLPQHAPLHFVPGETWGARFVRRTDGVKSAWPPGSTAVIAFTGAAISDWVGAIDPADPSAMVFAVNAVETAALGASAVTSFSLRLNGGTTHYGPIVGFTP